MYILKFCGCSSSHYIPGCSVIGIGGGGGGGGILSGIGSTDDASTFIGLPIGSLNGIDSANGGGCIPTPIIPAVGCDEFQV